MFLETHISCALKASTAGICSWPAPLSFSYRDFFSYCPLNILFHILISNFSGNFNNYLYSVLVSVLVDIRQGVC